MTVCLMKNFWCKRRLRRRKGSSLIELIAAIVILSFIMVLIGRVTLVRLADQENIDAQYSVLSADAFFADIYEDFHSCERFEVNNMPSGDVLLIFRMLDGESNIYGYYRASGECRKNGIAQFPAKRMVVQGAGNGLIVSIKLPEERLLEMNIFK